MIPAYHRDIGKISPKAEILQEILFSLYSFSYLVVMSLVRYVRAGREAAVYVKIFERRAENKQKVPLIDKIYL